jgi:hypothetical protein
MHSNKCGKELIGLIDRLETFRIANTGNEMIKTSHAGVLILAPYSLNSVLTLL